MEMFPLGPEWWQRLLAFGSARQEVGLACLAVDVMVAGHNDHAIALEVYMFGQLGNKIKGLLEFLRHTPLRKIARDHDQVRSKLLMFFQCIQVFGQPAKQTIVLPIFRKRHLQPAKHVVLAELHVREMKNGDRAGCGHGGTRMYPWVFERVQESIRERHEYPVAL